MKKKIMAVTLCLAMVSTFAVGCGQKNETDSGKSEEKSSGKVEIEFVQVKREAAESYTKVIEAFEKENPDIVIKQNVVPDAQEVLMTRASSDSLPDMMNHWPTDAQFVQFEDEGLLLDLSEKDYMKNIDSKYLDAVKAKDGKNYIAPYNVNFMGVYYNKDKFEEAGYTMPTKWDELIALAEEIKAKGETPFILPNKDSWTVSNLWSNIEARDLGSHEDEFEKMKAGEESFETIPEYKSGVEKMIQLLDYANEDSLALGYDQAINDFANGEGWMFLQGSWTLPSFLSANPDFNVEFTILPNDNGKPIATQAVEAKLVDGQERFELKQGDLTVCRFDDVDGEYYLFAGEAKTTTGPETNGTYVWMETDNWKRWEEKLMFGPYIHHLGCVYGHYLPVLREVSRYLGIHFDNAHEQGIYSL